MKKIFNLLKLSFFALMIISVASCSKSGNLYNVIPKNATIVAVFNGKTLSKKSGIENFASTNAYKKIKENT